MKKLKKLRWKWMVRCQKKEVLQSKARKTKVMRVESEESQGYACKTLTFGQEEADEIAFVPSAVSEPRAPICWCDDRCSEKAIRYWQIAAVVVE